MDEATRGAAEDARRWRKRQAEKDMKDEAMEVLRERDKRERKSRVKAGRATERSFHKD